MVYFSNKNGYKMGSVNLGGFSDHNTWLYYTIAFSFLSGALLTGLGFFFCKRKESKSSFPMPASYKYTPVADERTENNNKIFATPLSDQNGVV